MGDTAELAIDEMMKGAAKGYEAVDKFVEDNFDKMKKGISDGYSIASATTVTTGKNRLVLKIKKGKNPMLVILKGGIRHDISRVVEKLV